MKRQLTIQAVVIGGCLLTCPLAVGSCAAEERVQEERQKEEDLAKIRSRMDEVSARLRTGDRSPDLFRELAGIAHVAELAPEVVSRLSAEHDLARMDVVVVYAYYRALLFAGEYGVAVEIASSILSAFCNDVRCSDADKAFVSSFMLERRAEANLRSILAERSVETEIVMADMRESIELADSLPASYVPPRQFLERVEPDYDYSASVLQRGRLAYMLFRYGEVQRAREVLHEAQRLCPDYSPPSDCEGFGREAAFLLEREGAVVQRP